MSDDPWRRDEVDSPCVRICVLHPRAGICVGCLRTGDEIAAWSRMSPEAQRAVRASLPAREAALAARRGGRRRSRGAADDAVAVPPAGDG